MRTAKEMSLATIAVYSDADRQARHVAYADQAYRLGPASAAQSYLDIERILTVARQAEADAIHPGYGFLAENARFAAAVIANDMTWVGPHPHAIDAMGDKIRARQAMIEVGVPVVPGNTEPIEDLAALERAAHEFGFPLAIKASGGGGGKGLRVARTFDELASAFAIARREAEAFFKNATIYVERYLENPKHIELQVLADKHGTVLHVGERDCSLQRRHQKLVEEAPASISTIVRERLRDIGLRAARAIGYDSVGTIETLVHGDDCFFLEMNTRIQVEHTVSEMVSGLDLIREQLRVAAGEPLGFAQEAIEFRGHAIEGRVNAEDPAAGFRPTPGKLVAYREPAGIAVRVDSAASLGSTIVPDYDSMIAKLIVWAPTRDRALARLRRAIDEYEIAGIPTTLPFLRSLIDEPSVNDSSYGTATLETFAVTYEARSGSALDRESPTPTEAAEVVRVEVNDRLFVLLLIDRPRTNGGGARRPPPPRGSPRRASRIDASGAEIRAPMHGVVIDLPCFASGSPPCEPRRYRRGHRGDEDAQRDPRPPRGSRRVGSCRRRSHRRGSGAVGDVGRGASPLIGEFSIPTPSARPRGFPQLRDARSTLSDSALDLHTIDEGAHDLHAAPSIDTGTLTPHPVIADVDGDASALRPGGDANISRIPVVRMLDGIARRLAHGEQEVAPAFGIGEVDIEKLPQRRSQDRRALRHGGNMDDELSSRPLADSEPRDLGHRVNPELYHR